MGTQSPVGTPGFVVHPPAPGKGGSPARAGRFIPARPLAAVLAGLLLCCAMRAFATERLFFEAESMQADGKSWSVTEHFGWYDGAPSHGQLLRGSEGGPGTASKTLTVAAAGPHKLWVRYLDNNTFRGPFTVAVRQGDRVLASETYDEASVRATPEGQKRWGSGYGAFVWAAIPLTLEAGPVSIAVSKVASRNESWLVRHLDCFLLTDDLAYVPNLADFLEPFYVKATMGAGQQTPCVIHIDGTRPRLQPSYWITHANIRATGIRVGEIFTRYDPAKPDPTFLTANAASPWVNIAPLLDGVGVNVAHFTAMQEFGRALPSAAFTLAFSTTPSDEGIVKTFSRAGSGSGLLVHIDLRHPEALLCDRELSQPDADAAATLPPASGRRATRYPLMTGCTTGSEFYQPVTLRNELSVMKALGFNSIDAYDPVYFREGFTRARKSAIYWHLMKDECQCAPLVPGIRKLVQDSARNTLDKQQAAGTLTWILMDEPRAMTLDHIAACPACAAAFRDYLKGRGVQPAAFGKARWEEIAPVKDGRTSPELYYYTVNFRSQALADFFKLGTDALREVIPTAHTTANFNEWVTATGNGLAKGDDWFLILGQNALTYGWTEEWLPYSATYQLCGYRADFLRAACRGKPFGMYTILRSPWDTLVKAATEIGHGARALFYYNYGPKWGGIDAHSDDYQLYPALRKMNFAVGKVEDYLVGARVPKSRIGLLYARATDVWTLDREYSNFGKERMGLYLLLRHLGYPVEIVTEDEAAAHALGGYRAIFLSGSHLRRDAAAGLLQWVRDGGRLCCDAGSLTYDEFNRPLQLDAALGIARRPYVEQANVGRDIFEMPGLKDLAPIACGGNALESLCGVQSLAGPAPAGARVLATFGDGSPAALRLPLGKGQLVYCAALPGLGYLRSGVRSANNFDKRFGAGKGKEWPTYNPPSYDEGYRVLVAAALGDAAGPPPVATDRYLVEANLLEGAGGLVVALANWSGQPVRNLRVSLPWQATFGKPFAALGTVVARGPVGGRLLLTLDVQEADFIVIPYRKRGTPAAPTPGRR